ncbi:MAG: aminotransferase class V-fold PLP-dependent enzyme [Lachnospiraceae bacterium]|nr:aminotransferase class V-fold PLP-dependent enzyme [Lachnospiraceae bacterium]
MSVYLDYNASAPIDDRVVDFMMDIYKNNIGNADSRTHDYGDNARTIVENARKQVALLLDIPSEDVFFTSGATESNNIAIQGLREYAEKTGKKHIITTSIEHKAVLETAKYMSENGYRVDFVSPDHTGQVSADEIIDLVADDTLLVSVMHVNNETGTIQPVKEIGDRLADKDVLFHIDATQSCGKLVEEIRQIQYDMLSFSSHKMYGPQGIGALVLRRKNYKLPPVKPIMFGGQQEHGISPGTIPVALVGGLGKACEIAIDEYKGDEADNISIREMLIEMLDKSGVKYIINGDIDYIISSTLNIQIEGVSSEALMLSSKQYCGISNGSACTSSSYSPSYVLVAMGMSEDEIDQSIRLSWGKNTDAEELRKNFGKLLEVAKELV